jgi:2-keto-4-pentenoate hydratase
MSDERVDMLLAAYKTGWTIEPFEVKDLAEARLLSSQLQERLVNLEGFGGYKISFTNYKSLKAFGLDEPEFALLSGSMVVSDQRVQLKFPYTYAEAEIVVKARECDVSNYKECVEEVRLGLEIPATRFNAPLEVLNAYQIIADALIAYKLILGPKLSRIPKKVALKVNDRKVGENVVFYVYGDVYSMLKWLSTRVGRFSGYVSTGAVVGPVMIKKHDVLEVETEEASFTATVV